MFVNLDPIILIRRSTLLTAAFFLSACAAGGGSLQLTATTDMLVKEKGVGAVLVKKGDTHNVKTEAPVLIEAPGRVSTLIIQAEGAVTIDPAPLDLAGGKRAGEILNQSFNRLMPAVVKVLNLLAGGNNKAATALIEGLVKDYPNISFLLTLKASVLYVSGGSEAEIIALLKQALALSPGDEAATTFLSTLTGGKTLPAAKD